MSERDEKGVWWGLSLAALVLLGAEAMAVTFVVIVALNGYPSIPDAFAIIYLVYAFVLVVGSSLLVGLLAKRLSEASSKPVGLAGMWPLVVSIVIVPVHLVGLTVVLLLAFDLL
jgi:hypothetical protein